MTLVCIVGPLKDRELPITHAALTVGREADNHAALEDELVSRYHAEFRQQERQCVVRDLGSANGTWVNGERISDEKARLRPEDAIYGRYFVIRRGKKDNFLVRVLS